MKREHPELLPGMVNPVPGDSQLLEKKGRIILDVKKMIEPNMLDRGRDLNGKFSMRGITSFELP